MNEVFTTGILLLAFGAAMHFMVLQEAKRMRVRQEALVKTKEKKHGKTLRS